jgi:hypothetical protein
MNCQRESDTKRKSERQGVDTNRKIGTKRHKESKSQEPQLEKKT